MRNSENLSESVDAAFIHTVPVSAHVLARAQEEFVDAVTYAAVSHQRHAVVIKGQFWDDDGGRVAIRVQQRTLHLVRNTTLFNISDERTKRNRNK